MSSKALAINLEATDRGLLTCLIGARLDEKYAKTFILKYKLEVLEDFVHYKETASAELDAMVDSITESKDSGIIKSRMRASWAAACEALTIASSQASKGVDEDFDKPIPDGALSQLQLDWKRCNLEVGPFLDPSDALRGRVYREFRKKQASAPELKKIKSVLFAKAPPQQQAVELPGGVQLRFDKNFDVLVSDICGAYFQLRILAFAWAFNGNYMVPSKTTSSNMVRMMDLSQALAYADDSLRLTLEFGGGDVNWFLQRGLATRAKMATLIRRDWPASEALTAALRETYVDWHSHLKQQSSPSTPTQRRELPSHLREEDSGEAQTRKRARKSPRVAPDRNSAERGPCTVSMFKGNKRACKAWNDGRGCKTNCDSEHACDILKKNGKACQDKRHCRMDHDSRRHG